jgi:hypothetical protein
MTDTPQHIQAYWASYTPIFTFIDAILGNWKDEGCYKLPILLEQLTEEFQWTEEQFLAKDPVVRDYLRNHPVYYVRRGAHGGIGRRAEKNKKDQQLEARKQAKAEVLAAIEAELARKQATASANSTLTDNTNISSI